jgi:transposase
MQASTRWSESQDESSRRDRDRRQQRGAGEAGAPAVHAYKKRILAEYDRLPRGEQGALLRREGLYSSHVDAWRKQRDAGVDQALMPKKRGRKTQPSNPLARENAELRRKLTRTEAALRQARAIIDIQKKLSEELGIPLEPIESDESA